MDKDNIIIAGHTRYKAAKKLGLTEVPVIRAEDLTEKQVKAFRLADNRTAELAEWDDVLLGEELSDLLDFDFDMEQFGFEPNEIKPDDKEAEEDDYDFSKEVEPRCKLGDIYQLGRHYLMCGNSTEISDVKKLLQDKLAALVVTDPPYNMNYKGAGNASDEARKRTIMNDNLSDFEFDRFLNKMYNVLYESMEENASFYVFYKELGKGVFINALNDSKLDFKQELIWVKNQLVLGGSKYQNMYEPFLFGCKGKVGKWNGKRNQVNVIESIDLMNEEQLKDTIRDLLDAEPSDIIRERKQLKNDLHPTMKPIRLIAKLIKNSSYVDDIVLDVFGGSGSTLIACEQIDRSCYMMELDPHYCDVIIDRWEEFTCDKAKKISGDNNE